MWRVVISPGKGFAPHLPGQGVEAVDLRRLSMQERMTPRALSAYRPPELAMAYLPTVERPTPVTLAHPNGRNYRPLYIFPPDERHVLTDTSWPWLLIGKVFTSDGTSGSGALVGDRLVLTARHVAPWRSIQAGNWWMKFVPHSWDGTEPFGSSFVSHIRYPSASDIPHDYAVLRLYEPLGKRLGYFGTTSYDDDWEDEAVWASVGYQADVASAQRPAVQLRASIEEDYSSGDGVALETEADLNHGASGGPFWAWFSGHQARIVGVVSGEVDFATSYVVYTSHDYDNALAGGVHMVHLVDWGRSNWPA
jgi:hypothetical protein